MNWSHHDRYAIIRNQRSGLVLDAGNYQVKVQHYSGSDTQLWKLEHTGLGVFFIVNKRTGNVLDIQGGAGSGNNLITYSRHGGVNQQWYVNSDGTIVSAASGNLTVDISGGNCIPGANVIAFTKHGGDNQKFVVQHQ